jgi:glucokinase
VLLAGDIGGTKTVLAVITQEAGPRAALVQQEFPSPAYPHLEAIVQEFLARVQMPVQAAVFAVAGPVVRGRAKVTNLPWSVDAASLQQLLQVPVVHLLNDLVATVQAVPLLQPDELHVLNPGRPEPHGTVAVIAPGTGLGEAFSIWNGTQYLPCASEGGHADFAPGDALQLGLLSFLHPRFGHVSVERVCSGSGLPNLYDYLLASGTTPELPEVAAKLAAARDRTPVIVAAGLDAAAPSPLCRATVDLFFEILAAEAGNLALKVMATGGVYLAGGMPVRMLAALDRARFMAEFGGKGRMGDLLAQIPVQVVLRQVALLGAADYGLTDLRAEAMAHGR